MHEKDWNGVGSPGFIAAHHIDAVRRLRDVDIVGIAGSTQESAVRKAKQLGVGRAYGDYHDLIADPDIDVVHNTTPNYLHFPVAMAALPVGKHVISDKPLAMTAEEGRKLRDAALDAKVAHAVTFNYRGNPMVQQARCMVAKGEVGELRFVHGVYLQGWMTDPHVYSWRSDPVSRQNFKRAKNGRNYRVRRQFCRRLSTGYGGLRWLRITIESTLRVS